MTTMITGQQIGSVVWPAFTTGGCFTTCKTLELDLEIPEFLEIVQVQAWPLELSEEPDLDDARLAKLAAKHRPPASWYESDFNPFRAD